MKISTSDDLSDPEELSSIHPPPFQPMAPKRDNLSNDGAPKRLMNVVHQLNMKK